MFRKTNISNHFIRTQSCWYQGVWFVCFFGKFAYVLNIWLLSCIGPLQFLFRKNQTPDFSTKKEKVFHKYVLILVLPGTLKTFWHSDICYRQRFSVIIYIFVHFESFNLKYSENSQRITQESEVEVFSKWRWRRFIRWRDGKEVVVISVFLQKSCS